VAVQIVVEWVMDTSTLLGAELHLQLVRLLTGELSLDAFWGWLVPLQRLRADSKAGRRLLYLVIGRLDEYEHGVWSDEQLYQYLIGLLPEAQQHAVRRHREAVSPGHPAT
jgi:hypothetical protein